MKYGNPPKCFEFRPRDCDGKIDEKALSLLYMVCLFVCLFVCFFVCLFVCFFVCLFCLLFVRGF